MSHFNCLHLLPPEAAHSLIIKLLKNAAAFLQAHADDPVLATTLWGLKFSNPVGMAAGFDKHAEVMAPLVKFGFGFVETGSVTPLPQPGNPKPRIFRSAEEKAVINRMGFPSCGMDIFEVRMRAYHARKKSGHVIGVNLGKNKETENAADDYVKGVRRLSSLADYLVVNVSSPNTPGLRALQTKSALLDLLRAVKETRDAQGIVPLLVKIAPDLDEEQLHDIAEVVLEVGMDGVIVSNTTLARPDHLPEWFTKEQGGLSGQPLFALSTSVLERFYRLTGGKIPLIGVGGIASGQDAYEKIRKGASLVQLYSSLVYSGPGLIQKIKKDLVALLRRDGFSSVGAAVGADCK